MRDEKATLLAVASPEEWDRWLTCNADPFHSAGRCLFCEAYGARRGHVPGKCRDCMPEGDFEACPYRAKMPCVNHRYRDKIDLAIARLEAAGIWEEE